MGCQAIKRKSCRVRERVKNNKHARMREAMHHFVGYVDGSQRQIVT